MDTFTTAGLGIVGAVVGAGLVASWWWPRARRDRLVRNYAARRSLVLDVETAAFAERLLVAVHKGRYVATIPFGLASPILVATGPLGFPASVGSVVVISVAAQIAAAAGGATAMHRATRVPSSQRAAHLSSLSLDDFLPPLLRWWPAAASAASTAAVVAALAAPPSDPILQGRGLAVGWAAGLCLVAATEVTAQVLLRTPQHAASPAALAVRDEIKSDLLTVVAAGVIGPTLITVAVTADFLPEAGMPVAALMTLPLVTLETRRRHRVRQRLWNHEPTPLTGPRSATP